MKIRTGFVSNSSSSSFVIAVKPTSDMVRLVTMGEGYDTQVHAVGQAAVLQQLEQKLIENWEIDPQALNGVLQPWVQQELDQWRLLTGNFEGYELAAIEISMHATALQNELRKQERDGALIILNQEDL